jgi:hypothetical protein
MVRLSYCLWSTHHHPHHTFLSIGMISPRAPSQYSSVSHLSVRIRYDSFLCVTFEDLFMIPHCSPSPGLLARGCGF